MLFHPGRTMPMGAILLLNALFFRPAVAAWPTDPAVNVPISTQPYGQVLPSAVPDGAGGMIVAWADFRTLQPQIYAHHVLATGVLDPAWPSTGRAVCTATVTYLGITFIFPQVVTDGSGGAIIAWIDYRNGNTNRDVYAHHIFANGTLDPAWPVNGRLVCGAIGNQDRVSMVSDGMGGAVLAWMDFRSGSGTYAHHVLSTGVIDPAWTVNGVLLSDKGVQDNWINTLSDLNGGALVLWTAAADSSLRMQHIQGNGTLDPSWSPSGTQIALGSTAFQAYMTASGTGAIVTWRSNAQQILAQRITASGSIDPNWPPQGRFVSTDPGMKHNPVIDTDGSNGALIAWDDLRSFPNVKVYCGRVRADGTLDPGWPSDGRDLTPNELISQYGFDLQPVIRSDNTGGAIVAWSSDDRDDLGVFHIYAQRILGNGTLDSAWPSDGTLVCSAANGRDWLRLVPGSGSVIAFWQDQRTVQTTGGDIYCQRVQFNGQLGGGATLVVPPVTITQLSHTYIPPDPPFQPSAIIQDAVTFPGPGYTSSGFSAVLAPGDTVLARFQAPPGMKFVLHRHANLSALGFFCNANWVAASDAMSQQDPHTVVFENGSGTLPVETYSFVGVGNAGHVINCQKEYSVSGTFEFTALQMKITVAKSFTAASQTFGPVMSHSVPSWGAYAQTNASSYKPILTIESLSSVAVPDSPEKPGPFLRLTSANPSRGKFALEFSVPVTSDVRIDVFDLSGRHVARIKEGAFSPGVYEATWNGQMHNGSAPAGVYFIKYSSGEYRGVQRIVMLR